MSSYSNFQRNNVKNKNVADFSKRPANITKKPKKTLEQQTNFAKWIYMFRKNLDIFCEFHFGVRLHLFQKFWMYELGNADSYTCVASRGVSKTFIIALFALALGTLYPRSEIVIVAKNKKQAGLIISSKIERFFRPKFPNIAIEIKKVINTSNEKSVLFHNGSTIIVVPGNEGSRGERATFNIYEEFRLIDKTIIDKVISEFLHPRQTPFVDKYPDLVEEAKEVYISSAGFKSEWAWEHIKRCVNTHFKGDKTTKFAFYDYLLSLKYKFKTKKQLARDKKNKDSITFSQEVENLFYSESENAFFPYSLLTKARVLKRCWYPSKLRKNEYDIKKIPGEIRLVSMDVASSGKKGSDNSVITLFRLKPTRVGYIREIPYIVYFNGINSLIQTKILKSLFYSWKGDYIVLDVHGIGLNIYDECTTTTIDDEYIDGEYPALKVMIHDSISANVKDDLDRRVKDINCVPVIYPINGNTEFNQKIAFQLRNDFEKGLIHLLVDETIAEDVINKNITKKGKQVEYILNDVNKRIDMLYPYVQTTGAIGEMIQLETILTQGKIKLVELPGKTKDRYTSLGYGNYFAHLLELKLLKQYDINSDWGDYAVMADISFTESFY